MKKHPTKILTYQGHKVRIDKEIAPLLSMMWDAGIKTGNSCQESCSFYCNHKWKHVKLKNGGVNSTIIKTKNCYSDIWITFESVQDLEMLYNIVQEQGLNGQNPTEMSKKISYHIWPSKPKAPKEKWAVIWPIDNLGIKGHWGRPLWRGKRSTCEMWVEDSCEENNFVIQPQLTFPRIHLPYVEEKFKSYLLSKGSK